MNTHTGTTNESTSADGSISSAALSGKLPQWSLDSIYSSLTDEDYLSDKASLAQAIASFDALADDKVFASREPHAWLGAALEKLNRVYMLHSTLSAYAYGLFSVETANPSHVRELGLIENLAVGIQPALAKFRSTLLGESAAFAPGALPKQLGDYAFFVEENLRLATRQMSPEEESLAADLARSGVEAFTRLHESLSSNISRAWNTATGETKTMVDLRGYAYDPDRDLRQKAYDVELAAWKEYRVPLAASLNGVKGTVLTLAKRRGWKSPLDESIAQSRINPAVLDSLIGAMKQAMPDFRRYMKAKAALLGTEKLAFFDLFAPVGGLTKTWSFPEACTYIESSFTGFSTELGDFAKMAFDKAWVDAEPRAGKVGGGFCMEVGGRNESRILVNFTGSFASITTLAHELGHAWHSWQLRNRDYVLRDYPLTLAETASLFCETIVFERAIGLVEGTEKLALVEARLSAINQIVTDVLSRFMFESAVFERREAGEIGADELCAIMLDAQEQTYGDALDPDLRHPYMWAAKRHYYRSGLNFYNYPYAFGQLFGMGLYQSYKNEPAGFQDRYAGLLKRTGSVDAVELCREHGFDIETPAFWESSLELIKADIDLFVSLAESSRSTK